MSSNDLNASRPSPEQSDLDVLLNEDSRKAMESLLAIAYDHDLQTSLRTQLQPLLSVHPNLQRGLPPLVRFLNNLRAPSSFLVFLDRDRDALPSLLQILSIDSIAIEWLVQDPDSFDWLRLSAGQAVDCEHLKDTIINEICHLDEESQILASLSRFRKRESLRVICAVHLHDMTPQVAAQQFSWIADAGIAAALVAANAENHEDQRLRASSRPIRNLANNLCVVGLGALGGQELDLNGALELVLFIDPEWWDDDAKSSYVRDQMDRLTHRFVSWISHPHGLAYQVSLPLNVSEGSSDNTQTQEYRKWIQAIENQGRTWQRLALMKSRYIAGDPKLATRYLEEFPSIVYSRYLTRADIAGIGALKRKIDRDGKAIDSTLSNPWTIELLSAWKREVDFLCQFLQLVHGGELTQVRTANTLQAIDALTQSRCLTELERSMLVTAHNRFYEAILSAQVRCPFENSELSLRQPLNLDAEARTELIESWNRVKQIRDHLRGEVFVDENQVSDETDLILDPNPAEAWIDQLLLKYGFKRSIAAYKYLMELSREEVSMLSTRRCRHFLSIIAKRLLEKISVTPDPDFTLENLAMTCRSLGGKGVLWELFSVHEPSLDLYVRLCGASPYLIGILTNNPGMIDELLDSLMINRLPTEQQLGMMLHELCRGADDIEPIVHSFKNTRHLNVGVRDILGKESITDTHRALSDIADVCLQPIVHSQYSRLVKRFGVPMASDGNPCQFAVVALGKLGGREPNYHSDVTLLFLYDEDGGTRAFGATRHHEPISTEFFFHQLAQKVAQAANRVGRTGKLYETKNWIVSSNRNNNLSWKLDEFRRYLTETPALAPQRQELCNARCILGDPEFQKWIQHAFLQIVCDCPWTDANQQQAIAIRYDLEHSAGKRNLKRGVGGTLDVETIVQMLMLRHVVSSPDVFVPGTTEALERLRAHSFIAAEDAQSLCDGYNFLRGVESGLRLLNTTARHDLPTNEGELSRLAYVLRLENSRDLEEKCDYYRSKNRRLFSTYLEQS